MVDTHVHWIVYTALAAYMVWMLVLGFRSSKKIGDLTDYIVAGRKLPFHLAFATLFATWFGAGPCMGGAGTAYSTGLIGVIADPFAAGASLIIAGFFFVHLFRRLELLTATELFGKYYGPKAEIFASVLMIPVYIGWLGSQIIAFGFVLNSLIGIPTTVGILVSTIIVLIYTYEGGMWAVSITAFYQTLLLALGLLILFPIVMNDIGGFQALVRETPADFWKVTPSGSVSFGDWVAYAGQWLMMGLGCVVGQDLMQRSLSSKNEKVAKTSAISAGVVYILFGMIPILLGFAGRMVFPDLENPEFVVPQLAIKYLSPWLMALFICALLAVIMSSADSALLAATSLFVQNVYFKILPAADKRQTLKIARIATVGFTFLSMGIAMWAGKIYALMVNSWAILFVAILVPAAAALYWKKANAPAAWASMVGGMAGWIGFICLPYLLTGSFKPIEDPLYYQAAVAGGAASLAAYLGVTFIRLPKIQDIQPARELSSK